MSFHSKGSEEDSTAGGNKGLVRLDENGAPPVISIDTPRFNRNLLIFFIGFELLLVAVDAFFNYAAVIDVDALRRLCNIAREDGFATWFMVTQTLLAALTLFLTYWLYKSAGSRRRLTIAWLVLAIFFTYMAADDDSQIHERLGSTFETAMEHHQAAQASEDQPVAGVDRLLGFFPSYPWQLVILPFFALMGLFMFNFLWDQLATRRDRLKLVAAISCFVVALGLDFVEGIDPEKSYNIYTIVKDHTALSSDFVDHFSKSLEEFLEMLAMTLLLSIFIVHLSHITGSFRVKFLRSSAPPVSPPPSSAGENI